MIRPLHIQMSGRDASEQNRAALSDWFSAMTEEELVSIYLLDWAEIKHRVRLTVKHLSEVTADGR